MFVRRPKLKDIDVSRIISFVEKEKNIPESKPEPPKKVESSTPISLEPTKKEEKKKIVISKSVEKERAKEFPTPGKDIEWL